MSTASVTAYHWDLLPKTSCAAVRAARHIRSRLSLAVRLDRLEVAVGDVLGGRVSIVLKEMSSSTVGEMPHAIHLALGDGSLSLLVEPEPSLATAALSRLLGRAVEFSDPLAPTAAALRGALAAILVESARRSDVTVELRARSDVAAPGDGLRLDATLLLDGRPYGVTVWALTRMAPTTGSASDPDLAVLGELPIRMSVVAALSVGTRDEIESLAVGDVWLPREGWLHEGDAPTDTFARVLGRAALAAPDGEHGVEVGCSAEGRLVLRGKTVALGADLDAPASLGTMSDSNKTLQTIALDAPVVVRVEVASVTLSAREWANLGPGDVIETGVVLTEPVVLRVAGREVARGELVNVEGELGVRIREITA